MTEPDIRDLLTELVDPIEPPDAAGTAWDRMLRQRRQRRTAIGAGATASALIVVGGVAFVRDRDGSASPVQPGPTVSSTTGDPTTSVSSEVTIDGFQVWKAPTLVDESSAPTVVSPLPNEIDLTAPNPSVQEAPIDSAIAAFGISKVVGNTARFDGVMLVSADGQLRHLDATRLDEVPSRGGGPSTPFNAGSLSPDGSRLVFEQPGGVAVYDLPTNQWSWFDVGDAPGQTDGPYWSPDGTTIRFGLATLDPSTGRVTIDRIGSPLYSTNLNVEYWWGAERISGGNHARAAAYLDESVPIAGVEANPPAVVVAGDVRALLVIPDQGGRWKNCCAVAGWLDDETVAYESTFTAGDLPTNGETIRVMAWNLADDDFGVVTTVNGSADMVYFGSYADLSR